MKKTLEKLYEQIMDKSAYFPSKQSQDNFDNRFKSILHPDYSEYTTSTISGNAF